MTSVEQLPFDEIVFCDFEFYCPPGEVPTPLCMVAVDAVRRQGS